MLFNSIHFLAFLPIVLFIYLLLKGKKQRIFLLLASLYFYMAWNYSFIFLLLFSIVIDYFASIQISKLNQDNSKRKLYLLLSLATNLGFLGYFKYTNFFIGVINDLSSNGLQLSNYEIILPVGISFYTFQSMSYTIDVYRKKISVQKSFIDFALYVSFFPQLVAGPIVRAETFFRDLNSRLPIDIFILRLCFAQILLGFTKKIVFADNLAVCVDAVFQNHENLNFIEIWTGVLAFMWQIYFDFSGYTDIAIGVARLFGFKFDINFYFPFNVKSISDHWSRWHISFTSWIRDYIFIPLGGSRVVRWRLHLNILITFLFGGLWHGAAYHFLAWGLWHSIMISVEREFSQTRVSQYLNEKGGKVYWVASYLFTIFCIAISLPLFRAHSINDAISMLTKMLWFDPQAITVSFINHKYFYLVIMLFITGFIFEKFKLKKMVTKPRAFTGFLLVNVFLLLFYGVSEAKSFIYFAF